MRAEGPEREREIMTDKIDPVDPGEPTTWRIEQVYEGGHVVAEIGYCTDPLCHCEGSIVYWDDRE
jgi:hypothetical protein